MITKAQENQPTSNSPDRVSPPRMNRRALVLGGGAAAAGLLTYPLLRRAIAKRGMAFIARGQSYNGPLEQTLRDGLLATGFEPAAIAGKRVLLKPNLVEPTRKSPQMTTHPAMVVAAAAVFRQWGAKVIVGEGPGHVRDT
ncbi:MAG TPA: DUF362 domain-containing protein, partial [Pirellulales bacterium]|nr:DUF362 domain-containing protein [Pirellulales bacterium]